MQVVEGKSGADESQLAACSAGRVLLAWGSLALAVAESICVAAVGLSGLRVAIGMSSLIAATAGGPARGFHREALRVPFLVIGPIGACLTLLLVWNEDRLRKNPAAAWRVRPLTRSQRRRRAINVSAALVTLLLVVAEVISHPWFHHEL